MWWCGGLNQVREMRPRIWSNQTRHNKWGNQKAAPKKKNSKKEMQSKLKVISAISAKTCQMGRQAVSWSTAYPTACRWQSILQADVTGALSMAQNNWQTAGDTLREDMKIWHRNAKSWKQTNTAESVCLFPLGGEGIGLACLFVWLGKRHAHTRRHTADDALHVLYLKLEEFRRRTNAFAWDWNFRRANAHLLTH